MASQAQSLAPAAAPEIVGQVLAVPVADIEFGERLRPVDPVHAKALAALMYQDGQHRPIEVCRLPGRSSWTLVVGAHRLAGAQLNNWETIKAIVVSADALARRQREISENLFHSGLSPIDRAAFVAELVQLHKLQAGIDPAKDGRSVSAQARWQKELKQQADDATASIAVAYGWADQVGESLGLSARTIRDDLFLHRGLPAALITRLRGLPIASNAGQLRALAKLAASDQTAVVGLLADGKANGLSDALGILHRKPKPDTAKKAWSAFFGGWGRMGDRQRRDALREMAEQGPPKGVKITFEDGEVP